MFRRTPSLCAHRAQERSTMRRDLCGKCAETRERPPPTAEQKHTEKIGSHGTIHMGAFRIVDLLEICTRMRSTADQGARCHLLLCCPEPHFRPHAKRCFATATGKAVIKFEGRLRRWPRPKRVWRRRGDALTLAFGETRTVPALRCPPPTGCRHPGGLRLVLLDCIEANWSSVGLVCLLPWNRALHTYKK